MQENPSDHTYTVTLPEDSTDTHLVKISAGREGQVVVAIQPDGSRKVIRKSLVTDGMARFLLKEGATVRLEEATVSFPDVENGAWYADAVRFAASRGIFSGVDGGRFAPDLPLSRSMLAMVLYRLEEPTPGAIQNRFRDVPDSVWYTDAVAWAAEQQIVYGCGADRFAPEDPLTREQLACMLWRYAGMLGLPTGGRDTLSAFPDRDQVSPWAEDAVAWAVDSRILSGTGDGRLAPEAPTTRAEGAAMLCRLVSLMLQ